jgi:branched-chain amino acid aminotransferase
MSDFGEVLVYFENDIVPLKNAKVNILTHGLHYGTGVFEGIRGYWSADEQELFLVRCEDHYRRWKANCGILNMELSKSPHELAELTAELVRLNHFRTDVYVRPLAYYSSPRIGVRPDGKFSYAIVALPFGVYMESAQGIHAGVVSWRRLEDSAMPCRAKICGAYVNSVLATTEAHAHGYDEAILLNDSGHVAEGATCNFFMVRNGKLITPPPSDNILEGITRASVMDLAKREMHLEVVERSIDRSELYVADEMFLTGTAVEVAPITRVDRHSVGLGIVGPVTDKLRELYFEATRGKLDDYRLWLQAVYQPVMEALRR